MTESAPTRRERRKLWRALRKLRQPTELVNALNRKAQLQAQRRGPPRPQPEPGTITVTEDGCIVTPQAEAQS